jgi:hypothetical protein
MLPRGIPPIFREWYRPRDIEVDLDRPINTDPDASIARSGTLTNGGLGQGMTLRELLGDDE